MKTEIEKSLEPAITLYTKMIEGKDKPKQKVIAYDFIEELWVALAENRIVEGMKQAKKRRNGTR